MEFNKRPQIYVIDDEIDILFLYREILSSTGEVHCFLTANEFIEFQHEKGLSRPAVIVSDFVMPEMNGVEMLQALHAKKVEIPPVILISGNLDKDKAIQSTNSGAELIIEKPFDSYKLKQHVEGLLIEQKYELLQKELFKVLKQMQEVFAVFQILNQDRTCYEEVKSKIMFDLSSEQHSTSTLGARLEELEQRLFVLNRAHHQLSSCRSNEMKNAA